MNERDRLRGCLRVGAVLVGVAAVLSLSVQAQVVQQLTDVKVSQIRGYALDDAGTLVVAASHDDPLGTNLQHAAQVFQWTVPGLAVSQLTGLLKGTYRSVSVTDDGQWITFLSPDDPAGQNHDGSLELFRVMADGSNLTQLTNDPQLNAGSVDSAIISGSGNKVVFLADTDPVGGNPDNVTQLFVVDTTTLVITQLTTNAAGERQFLGYSITDDGLTVVFSREDASNAYQIFRIDSDGQNFVQLTSVVQDDYFFPMISGDGSKIVFQRGFDEIRIIGSDGTGQLTLADGRSPSITDDASLVYFSAEDRSQTESNLEIARIPGTGGQPMQLTQTPPDVQNEFPLVSGDNTRVVFFAEGELKVMDANGTNLQTLGPTGAGIAGAGDPDITPDGTRIVFASLRDPAALVFPDIPDIFRVQADGSDLFEVAQGATRPSVTADGNTIVFISDESLGVVGDEDVFSVQADGTGLLQLTPTDDEVFTVDPVVARNGSVVVFQSTGDFAGTNADESGELFAVSPNGGPITQVTDDDSNSFKHPRLTADGQWVVYTSSVSSVLQVHRARTDGSLVEQLTTGAEWAFRPDVSADGQRIVYYSAANPLGTNADNNLEIFLLNVGTSTAQQLTLTTEGSSRSPRISGDGELVYFASSAPFFENRDGSDLYHVTVATGVVERAGGLRDPRGRLPASSSLRVNPPYAVDSSGNRTAFIGPLNAGGANMDISTEVWLADLTTPARLGVTSSTPSIVHWDAEARGLRYDVIRGDVANLQPGAGNTVDLGTVLCLEDDSPDNSTLGFGDALQPDPGQVLFYVYRATQGMNDGPGSWGRGTGDAERIAGTGDCQP